MKPTRSSGSRANVGALEHGSKFFDYKTCKTIETAAPDVLSSEVYLKNKHSVFREKHNIAKNKFDAAKIRDVNVASELEGIRSQEAAFFEVRGFRSHERSRAAYQFYNEHPELLQRKNELTRVRKETNDQAQKTSSALKDAASILDEVEAQITNAYK